MSIILSVKNLRKEYGKTIAVDGVSFDVGQHEIVGLLGPNGAGKTTIISTILGVLEQTNGTITIAGMDTAKDRSAALSRTNFAAVYTALPGNLTIYENLKVFGLLYSVKDLEQKISKMIRRFDLEPFKDAKCGLLSSGEQTRACLAKAMLNSPSLLLLDEPTASLDPSSAREIRARIKTFSKKEGKGILWTSHNMHEVEEMCDRVLFLSCGRILLEGNPKTLAFEHGKKNLEELFISLAKQPLSSEVT